MPSTSTSVISIVSSNSKTMSFSIFLLALLMDKTIIVPAVADKVECPCFDKFDLNKVTSATQDFGSCSRVKSSVCENWPNDCDDDDRIDDVYYVGRDDRPSFSVREDFDEDGKVTFRGTYCKACTNPTNCDYVNNLSYKQADACRSLLDDRCDRIGVGGCPCYSKESIIEAFEKNGQTLEDANDVDSTACRRFFGDFHCINGFPYFEPYASVQTNSKECQFIDPAQHPSYANIQYNTAEANDYCLNALIDLCEDIGKPFLPIVWNAATNTEIGWLEDKIYACSDDKVNIEAIVNKPNNRVIFKLFRDGKRVLRTTSETFPYMLVGSGGDISAVDALKVPGSYELVVEPRGSKTQNWFFDVVGC